MLPHVSTPLMPSLLTQRYRRRNEPTGQRSVAPAPLVSSRHRVIASLPVTCRCLLARQPPLMVDKLACLRRATEGCVTVPSPPHATVLTQRGLLTIVWRGGARTQEARSYGRRIAVTDTQHPLPQHQTPNGSFFVRAWRTHPRLRVIQFAIPIPTPHWPAGTHP